jgi:biopolymer transport protein ExbD
MASIAPSPARGRRRALDAVINLVPFIDLLSCCIAFLLATAMWMQVARLDVKPAGSNEGESTAPPSPSLTLEVGNEGLTLSRSSGESLSIRAGGDELARLADALRVARSELARDDITVRADDAVPYQRLVRALDVVVPRFPAISVIGGE